MAEQDMTHKVGTVNDMMDEVELEIAQLKSGELSVEMARVVARLRGVQFQGLLAMIAAARLERKMNQKLRHQLFGVIEAAALPPAQIPPPEAKPVLPRPDPFKDDAASPHQT